MLIGADFLRIQLVWDVFGINFLLLYFAAHLAFVKFFQKTYFSVDLRVHGRYYTTRLVVLKGCVNENIDENRLCLACLVHAG